MSVVNTGNKLLKSSEVIEKLKDYGINLTRASLRNYVKEGLIPPDYYVIKRHGRKNFYYFRPEVVEYIVNKLEEG